MEEILRPSQVAELLQVHVKTVYRLAEHGEIPGKRIGRSWRFSKTDILDLATHKPVKEPIVKHNGNGGQSHHKIERGALLQEITQAITSTLDLRSVLEMLMEKVDRLLPYTAVLVWLINSESGDLERTVCRNIDEKEWKRRNPSVIPDLPKTVVKNKAPVVAINIQIDRRTQHPEFFRDQGLISHLGVPLIAKGEVLGVLSFFTREEHKFSDEEIEFLSVLAGQAAIAIHNSQLYDQLKQRTHELSALNTVSTVVNQTLDLDFLLRSVMEKVLEIFDFDAARIYLFDEETKELRLLAHQGFSQDAIPTDSYKPGQGILGKVFERGEPIFFEDIQTDPEFHRLVDRGVVLRAGFRGSFGIPIMAKDKALGVINFVSKSVHRFPSNEVQLIHSISNHIAVAIVNAQLHEETKKQALQLEKDVTDRKREEEQALRQMQRLTILDEITKATTSTLDLHTILNVLLDKIDLLLPYSVTTLRLLNKETGLLEAVASRNIDEEEWKSTMREGGRGFSKGALKKKGPVIIDNVQKSVQVQYPEFLRKYGLISYLGVPLIVKDNILGTLGFYTKEEHKFSKEEVEFITTLAGQAAIAIHNSQLFEQVEGRTRELSALYSVSTAVSHSLELEPVLQEVIKKITEIFSFDCTRIFLFTPQMDELRMRASYETNPEFWPQVQFFRRGQGVIGNVAETGEPFICEDAMNDPRYQAMSHSKATQKARHRFMAIIPIKSKTRTVGTIVCIGRASRHLTPSEVQLIVSMAGQIGVIVENANLFQETAVRAKELSTLYSVATVVNQYLDVESIMRSVMEKVLEIFDFDAARTYLADRGGEELQLVSHAGSSEELMPNMSYRPGDGITGKVFKGGEPILFEDIQNDPEFRKLSQSRVLLKGDFRALFSMPIVTKGKIIGVMNFASKNPHRFSPEEVRLLRSISSHVGIAVDNATLYRETQRREEIQGLLKELSQDITSPDIDSLLKKLTDKVREVFQVDICDVRVKKKKVWHVLGVSGIDPERVVSGTTGTSRGRSSWIIQNRKPLSIPDITKETEVPIGETTRQIGVRSYLGVPLFSSGGEVVAVLRAMAYQPREFNQEEVQLLQQLANGTAIAMENVRLFQEVRLKSRELEALVKINKDIAALLDRDVLLPRIAEEARMLLKVQGANFRLIEGDFLEHYSSTNGEGVKFRPKLRLGESLTGKIIRENRVVVIRHVAEDPTIIEEHREKLRKSGYHAYLGVPLQIGGRVIGAINLYCKEDREFSNEDVAMISAFADQAAIAVENSQLYERTKKQALQLRKDVEELKGAEEEIHKLNEGLEQRVLQRTVELEAANKELEAFSYSVSHDLRAPLRAIHGFSRILMEEHEPQLRPECQRYLHLVHDNAQQMGCLIDDLLTFARLNRQPLKKQTVAPVELVQEVLEDLRSEQGERRFEITVGDLPVCQCDPALLKLVFINLLSNAFKFTRQREVAEIEIGCREENGDRIYFVRDNGVAFDMKYIDKLFGVFQRLHRAEDYEGTGVGLATVQRIILRHGGRVWASAKLNEGATFSFTLDKVHTP